MTVHHYTPDPDPRKKPERRYGVDFPSPEHVEAERAHRRTRRYPKPQPKAGGKTYEQHLTEKFEGLAKGRRREARRIAKEGQLTPAERQRLIHLQKLDRTGRRDEFTKEDRQLFRRGVPLMEAEDQAEAERKEYERLKRVMPADYVADLEEGLQIDDSGKYSRRLGGSNDG